MPRNGMGPRRHPQGNGGSMKVLCPKCYGRCAQHIHKKAWFYCMSCHNEFRRAEPYENFAGRHRFGDTVTLRELFTGERGFNWALVFVILACTGFWVWVGVNVARWWP